MDTRTYERNEVQEELEKAGIDFDTPQRTAILDQIMASGPLPEVDLRRLISAIKAPVENIRRTFMMDTKEVPPDIQAEMTARQAGPDE